MSEKQGEAISIYLFSERRMRDERFQLRAKQKSRTEPAIVEGFDPKPITD